jgi:hypothetical protein
MNTYISIGSQCTTALLFNNLQVKKESFPFDWMFSTPQFVYTIIKLLLIDKKNINDIVDNYFFVCDKRAQLKGLEHFILNENGPMLINSKYNVCFPHDKISDRDKYIRRMIRFKEILLNKDIFIYFMYVSVSSPNSGNYTINGIEPIQNLYEYIEKINNIIKDIRTTYKIIVFDTNKPSGVIPSDFLHLMYYDIEKKNSWGQLLPELIDICNNIINNKVIKIDLNTSPQEITKQTIPLPQRPQEITKQTIPSTLKPIQITTSKPKPIIPLTLKLIQIMTSKSKPKVKPTQNITLIPVSTPKIPSVLKSIQITTSKLKPTQNITQIPVSTPKISSRYKQMNKTNLILYSKRNK